MKKVAFITGSSRGIGNATALRLCRDGYAIVLHAKSPSTALSQTEKDIKKFGTLAGSFCFDISRSQEIETACDQIVAKVGHVDVLINNAATSDDALFTKMKTEQWEDVLQTNLSGPYFVTKKLLPSMIKHKFGRIVNISSIASYGAYGKANYAASKAGLIGLTKSLALEVSKNGVTVNAICPGFITSDLSSKIPLAYQKKILNQIASGRAGKPEEVANLISFLASNESSYITGAVIDINGGWQ